ERYKKMTADVLLSHRQIAMALLRPGWEKDYYGRPAIEPIVCVGTILSHEKLADGRYNFLLEGHTRARVVGEMRIEPYRLAHLQPIVETGIDEDRLDVCRRQVEAIFEREAYALLPGGRQIKQLLAAGAPIEMVGDLLAFHMLPEQDFELR